MSERVYYTNHKNWGILGKAVINDTKKTIHLYAEPNADLWGCGFGNIPNVRPINLSNFNQSYGGIPWTEIADSIRGYQIHYHQILVEEYDIASENWFKSLGCTICKSE